MPIHNKEKRDQYQKEYRTAKKISRQSYYKSYYKANKERKKRSKQSYDKSYYEANKERIRVRRFEKIGLDASPVHCLECGKLIENPGKRKLCAPEEGQDMSDCFRKYESKRQKQYRKDNPEKYTYKKKPIKANKDTQNYRKRSFLPPDDSKDRVCLRCDKMFKSQGIHNRICKRCSKIDEAVILKQPRIGKIEGAGKFMFEGE